MWTPEKSDPLVLGHPVRSMSHYFLMNPKKHQFDIGFSFEAVQLHLRNLYDETQQFLNFKNIMN
jgi:hypothetical protein